MTHDRTTSLIISSKGVDHICQYDVSDQELIEKYRWHLNGQGYAVSRIQGKQVMMHRLIMGVVDRPDIEVDHIFHNKLDNRQSIIELMMTIIGLMTTIINNIEALFRGRLYPGSL